MSVSLHSVFVRLFTCALVVCWAPMALAQSTWNGSSSTAWFDGSNWSGGVVPGQSDNVTIPVVANMPDVSSGVAGVANLDVLAGASVSVNGTGSLEVHGDLSLVSADALVMGADTCDVTVFGIWNQGDAAAVTSLGGRVLFEGGSSIAGAGVLIPYARLSTGTVTLLVDSRFGNLDATGGISTGAFDWVSTELDATLAMGSQPLHRLRMDAGTLTVSTSEIETLLVSGGELLIDTAAELTVSTLLEAVGGSVTFNHLGTSKLFIESAIIAGPGTAWGSGYVEMTGTTTTVSGPGGGKGFLYRLRFSSGLATLLTPMEIESWVGSTGGSVAGDWIELSGSSAFLSSSGGQLPKVRVIGGLTNVFKSSVGELEVTGGELKIISNQELNVNTSATLTGGSVTWDGGATGLFKIHGDLVTGPGMTWGDGFIDMVGTTTIDGPGGTDARVGKLRLLSGTCDLLHTVRIDLELAADAGTSTGEWFEMAGTDTVLSGAGTGGGSVHKVRVVSGKCSAGTGSIGDLELTGGILELPENKTLSVTGNAELLAGQLEFSGSISASGTLDVVGDVNFVGTTPAANMNSKGRLVCGGTWTAAGPVDLKDSFVEMAGGSTITGAAPEFVNLRIGSGAPVSLLNVVRVNGRLENDGGTSQGLWFEFVGSEGVLATGDDAVHEVRIAAGVTTVDSATVALLKVEGGELQVEGLKTLTVTGSLELNGGTLGLDPLDTSLAARIEVTGNVTMGATGPAVETGSGGRLYCDGVWFGNGASDLGKASVEFGSGATILGANAVFDRVRFVDGQTSLNAIVAVRTEIVVEEGATVAGFFPLRAEPGIGQVLDLSGPGTLAELHVIDGTVEAAAGDVTTLRVPGGAFVVVGDLTAGSVVLEGGMLVAREAGMLDVTGALDLVAGSLDFEVDPAGATGLEARIVAGSIHQIAALGGSGLSQGVLGCRGVWTGDAPLDLGAAFVELGEAMGMASVGGSAPGFGNLRLVDGPVNLTTVVSVSGALENEGGSSSGDWFELSGALGILKTGADEVHAVRIVGGLVRGFGSTLGKLELIAGELLIDELATISVSEELNLIAGQLGFALGAGTSFARLESLGAASYMGTLPGSEVSPMGVLSVSGDLNLIGSLALGGAFVELAPGGRLLGVGTTLERLRVVPGAVGAEPAKVSAQIGVTLAFESLASSQLLLEGGVLVLLPGQVSVFGDLDVGPAAVLGLGPSTAMTIENGGHLGLVGAPGAPAVLTSYFGGGYDLLIGGELEGRNFVVRDMDSCVLSSGATIGTQGLHAGSFERGLGTTSGPLVVMDQAGSYDFVGLGFVGGASNSNLSRNAGAGVGPVTVHSFGGSLGGAAFESDPSGLIEWENLSLADLTVLDLVPDSETVLGWPLQIDFSVVNQGAASANGPWVDRFFLSSDDVAGNADDVLLAESAHPGNEPGGGLYPGGITPLIPAMGIVEGTYRLVMETDAADDVNEPGFEGNNGFISEPFDVFATPRPNLVMTEVTSVPTAEDGSVVEVTWTVKNTGLGATDEGVGLGGVWEDRVYLSSDVVFGGDFLLDTFGIAAGELPGGIAPGESYTETQSVTLPLGIAGDYYFVVRSDALDEVTPESKEFDNVLVALVPIAVTQSDLPDLAGSFETVTSPQGTLYTGSTVTVDWEVVNQDGDSNGLGSANGMWRDRFWLSFDTVVDPGFDTLVFEVQHEGLVEPLGVYGGSEQITLPSQAGTWFLLGETDAFTDVVEGNQANNVWFQALSVNGAAWTGSVTTSFVEGLSSTGAGSQQISLTGQSTKIGSVQLEPNADLTVRVRQGNTRRVFPVTTNAIGAFSFVFEPLVGEAGTFDVFCDHPSVEENPLVPEASFKLHGLDVAPLSYSTSMVTGELRSVSFGVSNLGSDALAGMSVVPGALPAHLSLSNLIAPTSLTPGGAGVVSFDLTALGDAPNLNVPAQFDLNFSFDLGGIPTVATIVPASVWVTPFAPDPIAVGLAASIQVDIAAATPVTFRIFNAGGAPLTGASLSIPDAAALGLSCVFDEPFVLTMPSNLGDIGPGEARLVSLAVLAGACSDLNVGTGVTNFSVILTANEGSWSFPVNMLVSAAPQTNLTMVVTDVASWWASNGAYLAGTGAALSGALVELTDSIGQVTSLTTGGGGVAIFAGVDPGMHRIEIIHPNGGHQVWRGAMFLTAGQSQTMQAYMPARGLDSDLVGSLDTASGTIDYSLVQTGVASGSAVRLDVGGALMDLDIGVSETVQFDLLVTNNGGATARGIELFVNDLDDFMVTAAEDYLGDLAQGESAAMVISITRTGLGITSDLSAANLGLRYFVDAGQPVWHWTPLFVKGSGTVVGGEVPLNLPPPKFPPPLQSTSPHHHGTGPKHGGTSAAPARPHLPTFTLPL